MSTLVPGRSQKQCRNRWYNVLNPSIDRASGSTGKWTPDEDTKLKDAVQMHGGKNWVAMSALVPGRTKVQCYYRWNDVLGDPNVDWSDKRSGKWTKYEDIKLKDAVQLHGGKDCVAIPGWFRVPRFSIAALVPGRTKQQCYSRWHDALDPRIDGTNGRSGQWAEYEDIKLKNAVQTHGAKNWGAIAELVPGRTEKQCCKRWTRIGDPTRSTVREEEHAILNRVPAL
jgi:hypothetical protein